MCFSTIDVRDILSDDRIDNIYVKPLIMKIAEEWVMMDSRVFKENIIFHWIQLFCFFDFRDSELLKNSNIKCFVNKGSVRK